MKARWDLGSQTKVAAKSRIGQSSIGRAFRAESGTRLETVELIAAAFGLHAWQLLWPGLQPEAPPQAESMPVKLSPEDIAGAKRARDLFAGLNPAQRDLFLREGWLKDLVQGPHIDDAVVARAFGRPPHTLHQPRGGYDVKRQRKS